MENIIIVNFKKESQAYEAYSEIKRDPYSRSCLISQLILVEKVNGQILPCETFHTGVEVSEDIFKGGLLGGLIGILGGPIGILLGGSVGLLVGSLIDAAHVSHNSSILEKVVNNIKDGEIALVALVQETNTSTFDGKVQGYDAELTRYDAALIQEEVEIAEELHRKIEKRVKEEVRAVKTSERKEKKEEIRKMIRRHFNDLKKDIE
ncbi:DUF1269 domain-containing protein [Alloiococcus sp. CFN-8]|uniref:DUF1269 domain-containing protein n=1 Tax=Alloiococcus sp. CFN-8 TaxID=3416081 RepID=UPI003CE99BBF